MSRRSRTRASRPSRWAAATNGPRCSGGPTSRTRIGGRGGPRPGGHRRGDWTGEAFVQAGEELARLVGARALPARLPAPRPMTSSRAQFGNGKAAMMLQGQWAAGVPATRRASRGPASAKHSAGPRSRAVEGGAGAITDVFGGGDGFAVGRDAPPEAVDFLSTCSTLTTRASGSRSTTARSRRGRTRRSSSPTRRCRTVLAKRERGDLRAAVPRPGTTPDEFGTAINEAVAGLVAGALTPEEVTQAITDAAAAAS